MVNFRVKDLDAMVKQLRDAGITVTVDPEAYPNGRFARLVRPREESHRALAAERPLSGSRRLSG